MKCITLLTDFGLQDGYVGVMKGVMLSIAPETRLIDISHEIHPQDVLEASLVLERAAPYFPAGTVHLAVVDPGVGTQRRPIAARLGGGFFVGPDNGLLTGLVETAEREKAAVQVVHLNQPRYWLPQVSNVFHGRDIFAPVAAHIANGVELEAMGTPIHDEVRLQRPLPKFEHGRWLGQVLIIDRFGNLSTNITRQDLRDTHQVEVIIKNQSITSLVLAFGNAQPGEQVALIDSDDRLCICVVNGSAAAVLKAAVGDPVEVWI